MLDVRTDKSLLGNADIISTTGHSLRDWLTRAVGGAILSSMRWDEAGPSVQAYCDENNAFTSAGAVAHSYCFLVLTWAVE